MPGIGLDAAKTKLQMDVKKALKDGFKATFALGAGDMGDEIAEKFAEKASGPMADAIKSFVAQGKIVGQNAMLASVIAPPMTGGPCSGVLAFNGTELSIT